MSEQIVYGVWEPTYEGDYLLGLYARREDAEAHATRHRRLSVREHGVLDGFPGVTGIGLAKGWHHE